MKYKRMNQKTIYISDPDGTLMRNDGTSSAHAIKCVSEFITGHKS